MLQCRGLQVGLILLATSLLARSAETSLPRVMESLGYRPVELRRTAENHLYLSGRINGQKRSVLVDTGWSLTTLNTNTATTNTMLASLVLGRVQLTNQPVIAQAIRFNSEPTSFDLVLGVDFFLRHHAVIDCGRRRLFLRVEKPSAAQQISLESALASQGFVPLELTLKNSPAFTCNARVNGEPIELLVDTAAVWSCLDPRQLPRLKLKAESTPHGITGAGNTGIRGIAMCEAGEVMLGQAVAKDVRFAVFDLKDWGLGETQGILGGSELQNLIAVIDCSAQKLWLKPKHKK